MQVSHLSTILAALSRSAGLVPDPEARECFAAAAKAAEAMPREARVVIVGDNPLSDPWLNEIEVVSDALVRAREELGVIEDRTDDILRNLRKFRNGKRCQFCNRPAHPGNCTGAEAEGVTP